MAYQQTLGEWRGEFDPETGRVEYDLYETPSGLIRAWGKVAGAHLRGRRVIEPCSGGGNIARVLRDEFGCYVTTNDIDRKHKADTYFDAADPALWTMHPSAEVWVSNPPFDAAPAVLNNVVPAMVYGRLREMSMVMALLRITFNEPAANRVAFLATFPPQHRVTCERPSFRKSEAGSKTDLATVEWYVWTRDREPLTGVPVHGVMLWKP
jgi:hypothetical protein